MDAGQHKVLREATKKRSSAIEEQSSLLEQNISEVEEVIAELTRRLEPVLLPPSETVASEEKDLKSYSPLSEQLYRHNRRLQGIRANIADILERLDV